MFNKLSLLALLAPLVAGLTLEAPTNPTSGGSCVIKWTSTAGDPSTFSLELTNPSFNNAIAIANNVDPTSGQITVTLPIVPVGAQYTIQAVNIGDIGQVYSETPDFSVGATVTTSTSASTTAVTTGTGTVSGSAGTNSSTTPLATRPTTTASGFGITQSASVGPNLVTTSASGGSMSAPSSQPSLTSFNGASSLLKMNGNVGAFAGVLFSAVAGAAVFVL